MDDTTAPQGGEVKAALIGSHTQKQQQQQQQKSIITKRQELWRKPKQVSSPLLSIIQCIPRQEQKVQAMGDHT